MSTIRWPFLYFPRLHVVNQRYRGCPRPGRARDGAMPARTRSTLFDATIATSSPSFATYNDLSRAARKRLSFPRTRNPGLLDLDIDFGLRGDITQCAR